MPLPAHIAFDFEFFSTVFSFASFRVYYRIVSGSITVGNIASVCDEYRAIFNSEVVACIPAAVSFVGIKGRYKSGSVDIEGHSTDGPDDGTNATEPCPEEVCVVIRRNTGKVGRSKRGRIFFPFVPEGVQADGQLTSPGMILYKAFAYKLKGQLTLSTNAIDIYNVQPDFKNNVLEDVISTAVPTNTFTRRDRRQPKRVIVEVTAP